MTTSLPSGWSVLSLSDVLDDRPTGSQVQQGWSPQCEKEPAALHEWGVLKTTAIQPGTFLPEHNKRLPDHLAARPTLEVREGDLLLTNAGPRARCAIACFVRRTRPRLMISGKIYRFRPKTDVLDSRFLELFLLSPRATSALDTMKTGISDSGLNLTRARFLALEVPVPPLDEQRRIVDLLEGHLDRLGSAERISISARTRLNAWMASAIDRLIWAAPRSEQIQVRDLLVEGMRNGHSARASTTGAGVKALTLTAVTRNDFSDQFTKIVSVDSSRVEGLWLRDGDIFVQRANTAELVGSTALYRGPSDWAIFPDLLIRLRADEAKISSDYLAATLRSERAHRQLRAKAKGLAGSMPKIDQTAIGRATIPVPGRATQDQVVLSVRAIEDAHRRLVGQIAADSRGRALRRSLLDAAFSGRLVSRGHS